MLYPLDYADGVVDELLRLTRCQPYLVQLCGDTLVNWLNSRERRKQGDYLTATMADVEHVAREILHIGKPYFWNLWEQGITDHERQILAEIAQSPEGVAEQAWWKNKMRNPVLTLQQYQLIEPVDGRWRIQVELTRRAFVRFGQLEQSTSDH
jgi:hypothetical protein